MGDALPSLRIGTDVALELTRSGWRNPLGQRRSELQRVAYILRDGPEWFAGVKMALTGAGVLVLVAMARSRLFRLVRVGFVLQGIFVAYVALIAYEWWLLRTFL